MIGRRARVRLALWRLVGGLLFTALGMQAIPAHAASRGSLVAVIPITVLNKAQIDAQTAALGPAAALVKPALCDVRIEAIAYFSVAPKNIGAVVSGALITPLPGPGCPATQQAEVLSYSHGTRFQRIMSMADPANPETQIIAAMFASQGVVVVASDYLGYFASSYPYHPYLHAQSEADVTLDALRAARQRLARSSISIARVILTGYSQGGHAALATQRLIESRSTPEFPIAGSAPMSGPYALEKTVQQSVDNPPVTGSALAAFIIVGQQRVYSNVFRRTSDAFQRPYADFIANYMPGRYELNDLYLTGIVPQDQNALLVKSYREAFRDNANHPLRIALRASTLLGWTPRSPTLLCGGRYDEVVPFFSTVDAYFDFASRGAPVSIVDVSDPGMGGLMVPQPVTLEEKMDYHAQGVAVVCMAVVLQTFYMPPAP